MVGSFGYEAEHYEVKYESGEEVLFRQCAELQKRLLLPRRAPAAAIRSKDGAGREALHPVEVLWGRWIRPSGDSKPIDET